MDDIDHTPFNISANWILFPTEVKKLRHNKTPAQSNVNHQQLALYPIELFYESWFPQTVGSEMGIWRQSVVILHLPSNCTPTCICESKAENVLWGFTATESAEMETQVLVSAVSSQEDDVNCTGRSNDER